MNEFLNEKRPENTTVFFIALIISVLLLSAMLINRFAGDECIEWKIAATGLSIYSVLAPWPGRKSSHFINYFYYSLLLFFLLFADCIIYILLISKCKIADIEFYIEYVLFPLLVFIILSFIIRHYVRQ